MHLVNIIMMTSLFLIGMVLGDHAVKTIFFTPKYKVGDCIAIMLNEQGEFLPAKVSEYTVEILQVGKTNYLYSTSYVDVNGDVVTFESPNERKINLIDSVYIRVNCDTRLPE